MWFSKQGEALVYHDTRPDHIIIAKDISAHGHKKYGVFPLANVNIFQGPYNELIRTNSICRLYFDLDGSPLNELEGNRQVQLLIEQVTTGLIGNGLDFKAIVLCSSNAVKFSKHVIFPHVLFRNNWQHMRNFAATIQHPLVDQTVYSRNRCFRMAGCCKYSDPSRIFRPGLPADALVQCFGEDNGNVIEVDAPERELDERRGTQGQPTGSFDVSTLNVPDAWRPVLRSFQPDDLLMAIWPQQTYSAFFPIGSAYKGAGGSLKFFQDWCARYRGRSGVARQWYGWSRSKGYGFTFLKTLALRCCQTDECVARLNEAYGFHPEDFHAPVHHFDSAYLNYKRIFPPKKKLHRCTLVKSRTGSGKSTIARQLAQRFANRRILYLVSSRLLAYGAKESLNRMGTTHSLGRELKFVTYLESNKPLWKYKHIVLSIQSLWRAFKVRRDPYHLIVCDELSSIIEDMTNETNKHPRDNQTAFRWFSEHCKVWVGLDAHLMDTSLVLATEYFKDVQVHVNHHRGERKNAVFIPIPKWRTLDKSRVKACMPNAPARHVDDFSDATCMYDLMFDCWSKEIPTFLVCNNVKLGNWIEENYLRRSFTWIALLCAGFNNDVATLVTDFTCKKGANVVKMLRYAWIKKGDGRSGADFRTLDWWSKIDHLQYTLKICQGCDFNPKVPHFGVGFCYTTPNTAVPRRVLQQTGRVRKYAPNRMHDRQTVYFAVGERVSVKHLKMCGYEEIAKHAKKQEYFMKTVVEHHSQKICSVFEYMFKPEPVWRRLYLMVMNERETFLHFPKESFEWWLKHDDWTISEKPRRPKTLLTWQRSIFRKPPETSYDQIVDITEQEFDWIEKRRNKTNEQTLQADKFRFKRTFTTAVVPEVLETIWTIFNEHRGWVRNVSIERFETFDEVVAKRFGKLWQTQRCSEWLDTTAAKLVIVKRIAKKLGVQQLWAANGTIISPGAYKKAVSWVEANKEQIHLSFGRTDTVKAILLSWGGHKLQREQRARTRVNGVRTETCLRKFCSPPWELLKVFQSRAFFQKDSEN